MVHNVLTVKSVRLDGWDSMARTRWTDNGNSSSKTFPIVIAVTSFVYQLLTALACRHLSDDTPYVDQSITAYAWIGCGFSLLGVVGAVQNRSIFISAFANFLLLDTIVSAACRVIIIQLFEDLLIGQDVCDVPLSSHDLVSDAYLEAQTRSCVLGMRAVQIVFAMLLIIMTTAQGMLALAVRKHSLAVARDESLSAPQALGIGAYGDEKRRPLEEC